MKTLFHFAVTIAIALMSVQAVNAQGAAINASGSSPDPSAMLDVSSNTKGVLITRMTETERNAIVSPAVGLQIFNTTTNCFNMWNGTAWKKSCFDCDFATPVAGNNSPFCEGGTLNLTASSLAGATYSWTGPSGFTSSSQNPSISNTTVANAGIYYLSVTLNGCTAGPVGTVVTVNTAPATPTAGSNSPTCEGFALNLTATTISGAVYSWSGPNGFSSSAQNPTIASATLTNAGLYSVYASVAGCASGVSNTTVVVNPTVTANAGPDQLGLAGLSATLAGNTPASPGSGAWSIFSGSGGTVNTPSSPTSTFTGTAGTTYVLRWTQTNGCGSNFDDVSISFNAVINYATANEAYWTEKTAVPPFRQITIAGGATIYSYDATNKQYKNGSNILIPNLVGTANGQTVASNNFYGFSGGGSPVPSDINYQWDAQTILSQPNVYDVPNMFVSPISSGNVNFCQALQNNYASTCASGGTNVTIDGPTGTLAYPAGTPANGAYAVWNGAEQINAGNLKGTGNNQFISQQQLDATANKSYCVTTYGKGWRLPTDIEAGHATDNSNAYHIGYIGNYTVNVCGSCASGYIWTSSRFMNPSSVAQRFRLITGGPNLGIWSGSGAVNQSGGDWTGVRCVYSGQ